MTKFAPVILFVYKRLEHTRRTVEALKANYGAEQALLYVFSDGARENADRKAVEEVRKYLRTLSGFSEIHLEESACNRGLAESVIHGVSAVVERFGRAIVLEDDMVTSPFFLDFMNKALVRFETDERIASIHGYTIPLPAGTPEYFLRKGADCWGWAVWKRSWKLFRSDAGELYQELCERKLERDFDGLGGFPFSKMLHDQELGKIDSWAIRWKASTYLANKYILQSGRPLLYNIGGDGSGTHCRKLEFNFPLWNNFIRMEEEPQSESPDVARVYQSWLAAMKVPFKERIHGKITYEWNRLRKLILKRQEKRSEAD